MATPPKDVPLTIKWRKIKKNWLWLKLRKAISKSNSVNGVLGETCFVYLGKEWEKQGGDGNTLFTQVEKSEKVNNQSEESFGA